MNDKKPKKSKSEYMKPLEATSNASEHWITECKIQLPTPLIVDWELNNSAVYICSLEPKAVLAKREAYIQYVSRLVWVLK